MPPKMMINPFFSNILSLRNEFSGSSSVGEEEEPVSLLEELLPAVELLVVSLIVTFYP